MNKNTKNVKKSKCEIAKEKATSLPIPLQADRLRVPVVPQPGKGE
jgi:hypothetical protein